MVSGCCVRRNIEFLILFIPTPLVLALFCSNILTSLFIFKMFFFCSCYVIFVQYSKHCLKTFEIVQKSRSREHGDIIDKNVDCYESKDFHV